MSNIIFDRFALIECTGIDSISLLQGQTSADVANLKLGDACFFCLCNVKGRIIVNGLIAHSGKDTYHLFIMADLAAKLESTLARYTPFYKVSLAASSSQLALIDDNENNQQSIFTLKWPEAMSFSIVDGQQQSSQEEQQRWFAKMMLHGVVFISSKDSEKYLPSDISCDAFAISFTKGCYTGQEIVARVHYRGKPKKRLYVTQMDSMPKNETITDADGNPCGFVFRSLAYGDGIVVAACLDPKSADNAQIDNMTPKWQSIANASQT